MLFVVFKHSADQRKESLDEAVGKPMHEMILRSYKFPESRYFYMIVKKGECTSE